MSFRLAREVCPLLLGAFNRCNPRHSSPCESLNLWYKFLRNVLPINTSCLDDHYSRIPSAGSIKKTSALTTDTVQPNQYI